MRQIKTITRNITFTPVSGNDFYNDFFDENGNVEEESVIESVYCNSILRSTNGKADVIKKKVGRGTTDGLVRFRYDKNIIQFYGIQECKIKISKRTNKPYKNQVTQALLYYTQIPECKVIIINSENYFDYILIDENKELLDNIIRKSKNLLTQGSPSKVCKLCDFTQGLKIHTCDMPDKVQIDKIMLEIYRNCI